MNIYVSHLNFKVRDNELQELFQEYGEVSSAKIITDRETRRSRGFGFVEMPNDDEALKAIAALNQSEHLGRVISVSEAKPREENSRQ